MLWLYIAARLRHDLLVCMTYPPGPQRDAALRAHRELVDWVYGVN
jgi:hypothetical protein